MTKWKSFFATHEKKLLFLLVGFILWFFLFVSADEAFDWKPVEIEPSEQILPVKSGQVLERQLMTSSADALRGVELQFFAYGRENQGRVIVELAEGGTIRESWELNAAVLTDYMAYTFQLRRPFVPAEDCVIHIREEYTGENGIGICANGEGNLNYGLTYRDQAKRNFALLAVSTLYAVVCLWILLGGSEARLRMLLLTVCVLLCVWLIPPLGRDDEQPHLQRAYQIASGSWISPRVEMSDPRESGGFAGRDVLPNALNRFGPLSHDVVIDEDDASDMAIFFANYFPLGYLPHVLGVYIARCLTDKLEIIYYAGCISGAIFNLLICFLALSFMPFGKNILFTIMMLPKSIEQMSGITQDGPLCAASYLFLAYVLYLAYGKAHVGGWDKLALVGMGLFICLCKYPYVWLLLLLLLIPREKFVGKHANGWKLGLLMTGLVIGMAWTLYASGYLYEMNPGVNSGEQIYFILTHSIDLYSTFVREFLPFSREFFENVMEYNYLGNEVGPSVFGIFFLVTIISGLCRYEHIPTDVGKFDKLVCLAAYLGCFVTTLVAAYVAFVPVGAEYIPFDGRYLLPILGCFCVFLLLPFPWDSRRQNDNLSALWEEQRVGGGLTGLAAGTERRTTYLYILLLSGNGLSAFQVVQEWTETIWH